MSLGRIYILVRKVYWSLKRPLRSLARRLRLIAIWIGITIFAETPEEIAISIAAELIRHRAELAGTEKAKKG